MNGTGYQNQSNPTKNVAINTHTRNFIVLSSFALLLDIFVILLMLWNKKLRKGRANKLLLNLLLSDGTVCISFITYCANVMVASNDASSFDDLYLQQRKFVVLTDVVVFLSLLNLTIILDRLIAVKWPFYYEDRIQTKQLFIAIGVIWATTIAYGLILILLYHALDPDTTLYIILLASNSFVFAEARKQLRAFEKVLVEQITKSYRKENKFRKKEGKLVRINVGLILYFFLFWVNAVIIIVKRLIHSDEINLPINLRYALASWYLVYIYYMFNPLWYIALSHDVKKEVILLFKGTDKEEARNSSSLSLKIYRFSGYFHENMIVTKSFTKGFPQDL